MLKNVAFDQNLTCITPQRSFWMGNQTHPTLELFSYCGSVHSSDAKRELRRTYTVEYCMTSCGSNRRPNAPAELCNGRIIVGNHGCPSGTCGILVLFISWICPEERELQVLCRVRVV